MESEGKQGRLDFDVRQTRRFYLAGTVAFPTPFPSAGGISIENGSVQISDERHGATFVVVQEKTRVEESSIRVIRISYVAAMFFPGTWVDTENGRVFRFAKQDAVRDLEEGEWFIGPDVEAAKITVRLKLAESNIDISRRDSGVRGIVFVPEVRPVLTVDESAQSAGDASLEIRGQCYRPMMETDGQIVRLPMAQRHQHRSPDLYIIGRC